MLSLVVFVAACQTEAASEPAGAGRNPGGASSGATTGGSGSNAGGAGAGAQGGVAGTAATSGSANGRAGASGAGTQGGAGSAGGPGSGGSEIGGSGVAGGSGGESGGSGGPGGASGSSGSSGALCTMRTGGALMDWTIAGEPLRLWFTNQAFIEEMEANVGREAPRQPNLDLVDGSDCDSRWTWHADPENVTFLPAPHGGCSAWPSDVEADKGRYLNTDWCPLQVQIVAVHRQ